MPARRPSDDDIDEGPSDADIERFGGETTRCKSCGASVYDDSDWCHKCGAVLADPEEGRKPKAFVVIVVAILVAGFMLGAFAWLIR
jgi:uncharacterized protein (DUF983 family)